jgi:acetyl-CoA carboxylase carboxyl transferase subunit alpha
MAQTKSSANGVSAASGNGYLEFERPLARIEKEIAQLEAAPAEGGRDLSDQIETLRTTLKSMTKQVYSKLTAWETVLVARHPRRPILTDHLQAIAKDFVELHGDRSCGDDHAIVTGFARIAGHKVMVVGHNKGKDTREKIACNFGCAHPEGYRKALLKMKMAAKFSLPVVCLIDTQGAYPGVEAEERGIAQAIAVNLMELARLRTPIVCVVIGEGGSGGALGIGVGDRVAMFENSFYSVISPEGCAAILFKTGEQAPRAAESLHLTARDLVKLELVDDVLPEPLGGAHRQPDAASHALETYLGKTLRELKRVRIDTLMKRRAQKLRSLGSFFESEGDVAKAKAATKRRSSRSARSAGTPLTPTRKPGVKTSV